MRNFLGAVLLCLSGPVAAQGLAPDRAYVLMGSKHVNMDEDGIRDGRGFNEVNPGLILTWRDRWLGLHYSAGAFRNSFGKNSAIATVSNDKQYKSGVTLGWFAGIADYGDDAKQVVSWGKSWVPIGGLHMEYKKVFLQVLPTNDRADGIGMTFVGGLTFPIGKSAR